MAHNLKSIRQEFKANGVFYTDERLAQIMKSYIGGEPSEVYDPTCGDGALLSTFGDEVRKFGQELDGEQLDVARSRLVNFEGVCGDTLQAPAFAGRQFACIMANPPFSTKWEQRKGDERFADAPALAPPSRADYAFLLHVLHYLAPDGVAVVLNAPGILYRGNAEGKIRRYLVENNFVHAVIQLPPDLFFGTTIATCIIVLKKARADHSVLFVDAAAECVREGNKNRLTPENQQRILSLVSERQAVDHVAALVSIDDIKENDWNLSVSSYVEPEDTREQVDNVELNTRIAGIVERQRELRASIDAIVAELEADR